MQVTWQTTDSGFVSQPQRCTRGMVISRKDTVIIAVLINIALLAFLFATANREAPAIPLEQEKTKEKSKEILVVKKEQVVQKEETVLPVDEIDEILQKYLDRQAVVQEEKTTQKKKEKQEKPTPEVPKKPLQEIQREKSFTITVQEGDMLSKLAKKYGVSVASIVALNHLEKDALTIGQKLFIPQENVQKTKENGKVQPLYYTVKKGDSPWSIARKFDMDLETFLKINELTQDEAKNIRVGQKIRIR